MTANTSLAKNSTHADAKRRIFMIVLSCALALTGTALAASDESWELKRDQEGIKVFTRSVAGSKFKALRSSMMVTASLSELVALVRDTAACPQWAELCKESYEHEVVSETELYIYNLNDIPWPVVDRDAVAHVLWSQDEDLVVRMIANVVSDVVPEKPGIVRLSYGVTKWMFSPQDDGQVEITTEAHIDPAGSIPSWLSNRLLVDSPFKTMIKMRKFIARHNYEGIKFEFVREPDSQLNQLGSE